MSSYHCKSFSVKILIAKFVGNILLNDFIRKEKKNPETIVHDSSKSNYLGVRNLKRKCLICWDTDEAESRLPLKIACTQVVAFAWIVHIWRVETKQKFIEIIL